MRSGSSPLTGDTDERPSAASNGAAALENIFDVLCQKRGGKDALYRLIRTTSTKALQEYVEGIRKMWEVEFKEALEDKRDAAMKLLVVQVFDRALIVDPETKTSPSFSRALLLYILFVGISMNTRLQGHFCPMPPPTVDGVPVKGSNQTQPLVQTPDAFRAWIKYTLCLTLDKISSGEGGAFVTDIHDIAVEYTMLDGLFPDVEGGGGGR